MAKNDQNSQKFVPRVVTYVAQKKGGCIRKARGKTVDSSFSPTIMDQTFRKTLSKYMEFMRHEYWAKNIKKSKFNFTVNLHH